MRRLLIVASTLFAGPLGGQALPAPGVPAPVQRAMQAKFPGAAAVTWRLAPDRNFVAAFRVSGTGAVAQFQPGGQWVESAIEIGAITLPDAVRAYILRNYKGYQFGTIRRLDRASSPVRLFEVRLEKPGDVLTVQFGPDGHPFHVASKATPSLTVAGVWRGESICLPGHPACHDELVVYRVTAVQGDIAGFDLQASKIVDGSEEAMGTLPCSLQRSRAALYCVMPQGTWHFQVRHDSLIGGLTLADSSEARRVAVRRQP